MNAHRRGWLALPLALLLPAAWAAPAPAEVSAELGSARLLGQGRLRVLGIHVYDARLWGTAPLAAPAWAQAPLALELQYARALVGKQIAERSLKEMKRQGAMSEETAQRWLGQMVALFPDVKQGDRITGVHRPGQAAQFFKNGRSLGEVADADFARKFFGIWLAPQTSQPALRDALFGTGG